MGERIGIANTAAEKVRTRVEHSIPHAVEKMDTVHHLGYGKGKEKTKK